MNTKKWLSGVRVYIAAAIVLVTVQSWLWTRVTYGGTNLATIRLQEVYAWLSLGLLVFALLIGPALKVFPRLPGKAVLRDARRLIGVGAAWFATLHAVISYAAQFSWPNPTSLAVTYQQSLGLGLVGLIILLLMALTSFDGAMKRLGPWWFRLHRLVYVAGLAVLMHAFMIGTHCAELIAMVFVGLFATMLAGLHIYIVIRADKPTHFQIITLTLLVFLLGAVVNYGLSQYLGYNLFLKNHPGYQS